jgi:CRISPR-associated protein Cas5t
MASIACLLTAPVVAFRNPRAREYLETLPVPPPATVYGMLCSVVGETNRLVHQGSQVAIGIIDAGVRSRVLRTSWRVKDLGPKPGIGENKRPDFQELLVSTRLMVHVRDGEGESIPPLVQRLESTLKTPGSVERFGGLSLGESTHLVDELRLLRAGDLPEGSTLEWLVQDSHGSLALPVWPNHVGSAGTRYAQFSLHAAQEPSIPPAEAWVTIAPLSG